MVTSFFLRYYTLMNKIELDSDEKIYDLHIPKLKIIQSEKSFKYGIDAILLSDYAKKSIDEQKSVIDLGTGNGIIPIILSHITNSNKIIGLEIQQKSFEMAKKSIVLNNLENRIKVVHGDIKKVSNLFCKDSFDVVLSNPPYMKENSGRINKSSAKSIARHELLCNLNDVIKATSFLLKNNGMFYMIHRPNRMTEIFSLLDEYGLKIANLKFIHPFIDKEPTMVLINAIKTTTEIKYIEENLVIYESINNYTEEIKKIYRET